MAVAKQRAPTKLEVEPLRAGERRCWRCNKVKRTDHDYDVKGNGRRYTVCRVCRDALQADFKARRIKAKEARDNSPKVSCWLRAPDSPMLSVTLGEFYSTYQRMVSTRW
jgi:hypothetical protein